MRQTAALSAKPPSVGEIGSNNIRDLSEWQQRAHSVNRLATLLEAGKRPSGNLFPNLPTKGAVARSSEDF